MAVIDYINGLTREIYLHADTVTAPTLSPIDIYREMRTLRRTDETLRKWELFAEMKGYDSKGGGKYTERYLVLLDGTRIIPYDTSHVLTIIGTMITDDGLEGVDCFDRTPLSPTTVVDINYIPPQVEVITIESGTSGLTAEESAALLGLQSDVSWIKNMEAGEWKIENDQMIFYDTSQIEIARFDLFDSLGQATMEHVFRRVPV